ncbi:SU10 major capsid protein [Cloacibacillus porcorum]|uniref:SU10 major capsid protein n=1 Tax=Cloacibacillus porcorum TaxID=1197717 RepID=UPI003CFCB94D
MAATTQYNATAKVPDITKLITCISPDDTPLFSMMGTGGPATQVLHSWEEEELRGPEKNAQVEGFTYEAKEIDPSDLKSNLTQIFFKGYGISDTNKAVKYQNIKDVLGHKMANAMKEIGLDCEYAILNNTKKVTGSKTTPREMGGVPYFIKTNILGNGGTKRGLTYGLLNDAIEQVFNCGGNPNVIVASGRNKRVLSNLLPLNTDRTQSASAKKVVHTIDIFEGDFGRQRVMTNRWMSNDEVYILSEEYLKKAYLRPFKKMDLPKKGSATEKAIEGEWTIEVRAEKAHAVIRDLNGELPSA